MMWTCTSRSLRDQPNTQRPKITSKDFNTREEAESYVCRVVIERIEQFNHLEAKRTLLAASPEKLMDYGWLCDRVKEERWFVGRYGFELFTWNIEQVCITRVTVDVNDGWHLVAWKKMGGEAS